MARLSWCVCYCRHSVAASEWRIWKRRTKCWSVNLLDAKVLFSLSLHSKAPFSRAHFPKPRMKSTRDSSHRQIGFHPPIDSYPQSSNTHTHTHISPIQLEAPTSRARAKIHTQRHAQLFFDILSLSSSLHNNQPPLDRASWSVSTWPWLLSPPVPSRPRRHPHRPNLCAVSLQQVSLSFPPST